MSRKNAFIANQENFISRNFTNFTQSHFYAQKLLVYVPFFAVRKDFHLHKPKAFLPHKPLRTVRKSRFFIYKKPFFRTSLSLLLSKASLFCPPLPIPTTLNLLSTKNTAVLLLFALILCCKAGASHRFKSLPAIPGEVAAFRKTGYLMNAGHVNNNHVSTGDLNRGRRTESRVLFGYFLHDAKSDNPYSLAESSEVLQTSNQRTSMAAFHRNN